MTPRFRIELQDATSVYNIAAETPLTAQRAAAAMLDFYSGSDVVLVRDFRKGTTRTFKRDGRFMVEVVAPLSPGETA